MAKSTQVNELVEKLKVDEVKTSTVHRVVIAEQANKRQGTQSVRTRGEASGGGRKPYRQKKTGRARQGSIRAPHYVHGGMAFAVKPRSYEQKVNKKERRLATKAAFASRVKDGDVIVVDSISIGTPKTKEAAAILAKAGAAAKRVLVILPIYDEATYKSFRNLRHDGEMKVEIRTAPISVKAGDERVKSQAFSTRDLLIAHKIVVSKDALKAIEEVWA